MGGYYLSCPLVWMFAFDPGDFYLPGSLAGGGMLMVSLIKKPWNEYTQAFKLGPTFSWRMFHERTCRCSWCCDYWLRMKAGPAQKMTLKSPFSKREILEFGRAQLAKLDADPEFMEWIETECNELSIGWAPRTGRTYACPNGQTDQATPLGTLHKERISCLLDAARRHRPPELERKTDAPDR